MYQKTKGSWLKHFDFMVLDIVCLELTYLMAYLLRHGIHDFSDKKQYLELAAVLLLVDICIAFFNESHRGILRRGYWAEFKAVFFHVSAVILVILGYIFLVKSSADYSRIVLMTMWVYGIWSCYFGRLILKKFVKKQLEKKKNQRAVIAITSSTLAAETLETVRRHEYRDYRITGFIVVDAKMTGEMIEDVPVVASLDSALTYLKNEVVDEVFINLPQKIQLPGEVMDGCIAMGIVTHLNLLRVSALQGNKSVETFGEYTVITSRLNSVSAKQQLFKRGLDIAGGIVGTIITLLAAVFVAPIIYIQSPGPILFKQIRVGRNGRPFKIYKFRSMYTDAEERKKELLDQNEMKGQMFKMKNDPRIFPFGSFLRKSSIDELPQFINVLKGEMSLVGTRPPTMDEYQHYELWHKKRLAIKPGLTGMWQVSGRSDITDFEEVVELDTRYISEWSIGLDFRILLKTLVVVFGRMGAK